MIRFSVGCGMIVGLFLALFFTLADIHGLRSAIATFSLVTLIAGYIAVAAYLIVYDK